MTGSTGSPPNSPHDCPGTSRWFWNGRRGGLPPTSAEHRRTVHLSLVPPSALWGCAALVVVVTAAVLCVPDVRNLRRRTEHVSASARVGSADAESAVGGLG